MCQNPHEAELRNRTSQELKRMLGANPRSDALMKLMIGEAQRDQRVKIQKELHGKLASISSTCSLVRMGASGPKVKTGMPRTGSSMIRGSSARAFWGVSTI